MIWVNVFGGAAVLTSYAHGLATHPDGNALWGGVPETLRPLYTLSMLCAAAGYFAFASYFLLRVDPERDRLGSYPAVELINRLYALVLVSAAAWMPLTWRMIEQPGNMLWWSVRGVLAVTGLGSVGLLVLLTLLRPKPATAWYGIAVVGLAAFTFQTAILDALVWPWFFRD